MNLEQILVFCILMENGEGIVDKDPFYIKEKFASCTSTENPIYLRQLLDMQNQAKLDRWHQVWTHKPRPEGPQS